MSVKVNRLTDKQIAVLEKMFGPVKRTKYHAVPNHFSVAIHDGRCGKRDFSVAVLAADEVLTSRLRLVGDGAEQLEGLATCTRILAESHYLPRSRTIYFVPDLFWDTDVVRTGGVNYQLKNWEIRPIKDEEEGDE